MKHVVRAHDRTIERLCDHGRSHLGSRWADIAQDLQRGSERGTAIDGVVDHQDLRPRGITSSTQCADGLDFGAINLPRPCPVSTRCGDQPVLDAAK